jgi:hypothetical protein
MLLSLGDFSVIFDKLAELSEAFWGFEGESRTRDDEKAAATVG